MTRLDRITNWLQAHPGYHQPRDIAEALQLPSNPVASNLLYLADRKRVIRRRSRKIRTGPGSSAYAHPDHSVG